MKYSKSEIAADVRDELLNAQDISFLVRHYDLEIGSVDDIGFREFTDLQSLQQVVTLDVDASRLPIVIVLYSEADTSRLADGDPPVSGC